MRQPIWLLLLACVLALAVAALEAPRESAAGERRVQSAAMPTDYLPGRHRGVPARDVALAAPDGPAEDARHEGPSTGGARSTAAGCETSGASGRSSTAAGRTARRTARRGAASSATKAAGTTRMPPYYGGLQMDISFQRMYGRDLLRRKGTAENWTPVEQMWVAERALRAGRGFYPWPNTARYCGLL